MGMNVNWKGSVIEWGMQTLNMMDGDKIQHGCGWEPCAGIENVNNAQPRP